MKKKILIVLLVLSVIAMVLGPLAEYMAEPPTPRAPASYPANYESMKACEKQDVLWAQVQATTYKELPDFRSFGPVELFTMSRQEMNVKGNNRSDFAPEGWKKFIHGRAALAKAKLVPVTTKYTGIFQGADCALLRLSLTFKPGGKRAVAPGLAFKVLRDGADSSNISALVSLDGQDKDYNFFKYPLSNIVPIGHDFGQKLVHRIFKSASHAPEELLVKHMAHTDAHGVLAEAVVAPRQLFFVPAKTMKAESAAHDVRTDFLRIPAGTLIYHLYAASEARKDFDYANYSDEDAAVFLQEGEHIADVITTSEFLASDFGDDGIFFRHELK